MSRYASFNLTKMTDIEQYQELLNIFSKLPIYKTEPSFMDLCHYKGERFEEICSRILEFFFQPNNNHGFKDLWFEALCQVANCKCKQGDAFDMKTQTEEYTDNANKEENKKNRIDIVLKTPSLVVAIENKIEATLENNPLNVYKEHITNKYPTLDKKFIVLTAKNLSTRDRKKANKEGFTVIQYKNLFDKIRKLLGTYVSKGDQKYLAYMLDFIKTVENRVKDMKNTETLTDFFIDNFSLVEQLEGTYKQWKKDWNKKIKPDIDDLCNEVNKTANSSKWVLNEVPDINVLYILEVSFCNDNISHRIGIVSNFKRIKDDPLAEFEIYITTWSRISWDAYENDILKQYPKKYLDKGEQCDKNRVYYHITKLQRSHFEDETKYKDAIVERLNEYYRFIQKLAQKATK